MQSPHVQLHEHTSVFHIHNSEQSSGPQAMRYMSSGLQAKCPTPYEWPSIVLRCVGSPSWEKNAAFSVIIIQDSHEDNFKLA